MTLLVSRGRQPPLLQSVYPAAFKLILRDGAPPALAPDPKWAAGFVLTKRSWTTGIREVAHEMVGRRAPRAVGAGGHCGMRWMPLEVFTCGEPDPHPPGVAVRQRLRATPLDARPWRTWLLPSVNGIATWHHLHDRRADAVVGYVWVRRSALRWRRVAWTIWAFVLLAGITITATAPVGRPDPGVGLGGLLVGLALAALLLAAYRIRAVVDPDDGQVGVRE